VSQSFAPDEHAEAHLVAVAQSDLGYHLSVNENNANKYNEPRLHVTR